MLSLNKIDETITLRVTTECKTLAQRKQVQPRFRLRNKIRKAIAESMGFEGNSRVQIDSLAMKIDLKRIDCDITLSIHHFNKSIEIKQSQEKGFSQPMTKLIDAVNKGTVARVML